MRRSDPHPDRLALRSAAALVHRVPDGELLLEHDNGNLTVVGFGRDAQLSPCELRSLLGAPTAGRFGDSVCGLRVGGSFEPLGGSAFLRRHDGRREGWFVTALRPFVAETVLAGCELPTSDDDELEVHLVGDSVLGVTVASMRLGAPALDPLIGEIAMRMRATCTAEEVIGAVQGEPAPGGAA